jgi:4-aminobutyrate aminotransferase
MATIEDISPVLSHLTPIMAESGHGAYIISEDGNRYLDFTSGIGVTNTGHCHPQVVAAAQAQVEKLIHGQSNIVYHRPLLELMDELQAVLPAHLDSFFFANSGAEGVEAAIKLARHATRRHAIIAFEGAFHGRTIGTLSLTSSKAAYRAHYAPFMASVHISG